MARAGNAKKPGPGSRRKGGSPKSRMAAAIDVGSVSMRMCIAELQSKGRYRPVEMLTVPVRLGTDTFTSGTISRANVQAACEALKGFQQALKTYKVEQVRAVATSAVREAANADTFVDRVEAATGLRLEIVDGSEETRLTYGSVHDTLDHIRGFASSDSILLDLGAGSAEITIFHRGRIVFSETRRIGTFRLREALGEISQTKLVDMIEPLVGNVVESVKRLVPLKELSNFLLISPDAWNIPAVREARGDSMARSVKVARDAFQQSVEEVAHLSLLETVDRYDLPVDEAETLAPAMIAINTFLEATGARNIRLLRVSMIHSLLTAMSAGRELAAADEADFTEQVASNAVSIGRKYHFDEQHALCVTNLALSMFDQLQKLHGLGRQDRLLLHTAGILHDVGFYVSSRQHHKHSMYLVGNSECFGLTDEQMRLVSVICRYHRRALPRPQHIEYGGMARENRLRVSKLAAILRLADALDHNHRAAVRSVQCRQRGDQLRLEVDCDSDLSIEEVVLPDKARLFEQLYGLSVSLRRISSV